VRALPNLAARPFVNRRPLHRVAIAAWILGGLLAVFDAGVFWRYASGEGRRQQRTGELEESLAAERARIDAAVDVLAAIDLEWQSEQVRFVNLKADQQSFSWSRLFDQLAEVLPDGVRLARLNPGSRRGAARDSEALYEFVDALFAHPAFERPDLENEREREEVEFSLSAVYLPGAAPAAGERAPGEEGPVEPAPVEPTQEPGTVAAGSVEAARPGGDPPAASERGEGR
jgi:Tfp pilus assembly protein PilN